MVWIARNALKAHNYMRFNAIAGGQVMSVEIRSALAAAIRRLALCLTCLLSMSSVVDAFDLGHKRPRGMDLAKLSQLTTHEGRLLAPAALKGRPFVVAFGFTQCPDVCPTTLLDLSNHLTALGPQGDKLAVLFVTVDPERDTVEHLKSYLTSFDPRIIGLTGHYADVAAAAGALDAFYERVEKKDGSYSMDHTVKVHFFDRYGLLATSIDMLKAPPERVKDLMARLLAQ